MTSAGAGVLRALVAGLCGGAAVWSAVGAQEAPPAPVPVFDSAAARPEAREAALARLLEEASVRNRLPATLQSYRGRVESELAVLVRREEGTEVAAALEQVASDLHWTRSGVVEQHVVGYRAQQQGPTLSLLSATPTGWLNPVLYGNRLRLGTADRGAGGQARARERDSVQAVHPLAADRDRYYRFSGGDTVVVLQSGDRRLPIVQVAVQPRSDAPASAILFAGELALDASRGALVRLRGHYVEAVSRRGRVASAVRSGLADAIAFVEFEQGEYDGAWWLPARQRVEVQVRSPLLGDGRAVVRIVSRFTAMEVNGTSAPGTPGRRLTYASRDSLSQFAGWRHALGALVAATHSDDFEDIGPDGWRAEGPPRGELMAPRAADVVRYNRVEGWFTGLGGRLMLRDAAPGVVLRATAGWAWGEQTVRGRVSAERTRGGVTVEVRAGRSLDITNDFRAPLDSGASANAALGSVDAYDYVDRWSGTLAVRHAAASRALLTRIETGPAADRYRPATQLRGILGGPRFRPNRGVDEGRYWRSALLVEWRPDVGAEFLRPGVGGRLSYERGDGALAWQRVEARVTARRPLGRLIAAVRADAGVVLGASPPPQQLFELGDRQNLPGFPDKAFVGTRAAVFRGQLRYVVPRWQQPWRLGRQWVLPGLSPAISTGLQAGWADLPTAGAQGAVLRLVADGHPVPTATGRVRASVNAGVRVFGGAMFLGVARPVDQPARWSVVTGFGQPW